MVISPSMLGKGRGKKSISLIGKNNEFGMNQLLYFLVVNIAQ